MILILTENTLVYYLKIYRKYKSILKHAMLYIIQNTLHEEKLSSTRSILRHATFYKKYTEGY